MTPLELWEHHIGREPPGVLTDRINWELYVERGRDSSSLRKEVVVVEGELVEVGWEEWEKDRMEKKKEKKRNAMATAKDIEIGLEKEFGVERLGGGGDEGRSEQVGKKGAEGKKRKREDEMDAVTENKSGKEERKTKSIKKVRFEEGRN